MDNFDVEVHNALCILVLMIMDMQYICCVICGKRMKFIFFNDLKYICYLLKDMLVSDWKPII